MLQFKKNPCLLVLNCSVITVKLIDRFLHVDSSPPPTELRPNSATRAPFSSAIHLKGQTPLNLGEETFFLSVWRRKGAFNIQYSTLHSKTHSKEVLSRELTNPLFLAELSSSDNSTHYVICCHLCSCFNFWGEKKRSKPVLGSLRPLSLRMQYRKYFTLQSFLFSCSWCKWFQTAVTFAF